HATKPAVIHIRHAGTLCLLADGLAGGALGADEHDAAAIGRQPADIVVGFLEQRQCLFKINDMNLVAVTKDVWRHLRIPVTGSVAKMHASFQQLTHAYVAHECLRVEPPHTPWNNPSGHPAPCVDARENF